MRFGLVVLMAVALRAVPAAAAGNGNESVEAMADRGAARAQATADLRSLSTGQTNGSADHDDVATASDLLSPAANSPASGRLRLSDARNDRSVRWDALASAHGEPADSGQGDSMRAATDEDDDDDDDDAPPGVVRPSHTVTRPSAVALARSSLLVSDTFNHRLLVVLLL